MPDNSIIQQFQTQFESELHHDAQQMESKTTGKVETRPVTNAQTFIYNRISAIEDAEVTTRLSATVAQEAQHAVRGASVRDFRCTVLIDEFDELQSSVDFRAGLSRAINAAIMRRRDRLALEAADAAVLTTKSLGTSVSASSDGVTTISHGSVGLTLSKMLTMMENFGAAGVLENPGMRVYLACTHYQITDLMNEVEFTSGDFTRDFPLEKDRPWMYSSPLGVTLIVFPAASNIANPLVSKSSTTRSCIAWVGSPMESGICVGINKAPSMKINERPDLNNATQIQMTLFAAALRTEGVKVQVVQCTES